MNYELAKTLEDAGFDVEHETEVYHHVDNKNNPCSRLLPGAVRIPTLEELIEACGGKFGALIVGPGLLLWTAKGGGIEIHAYSPSEAVARLWLQIHK